MKQHVVVVNVVVNIPGSMKEEEEDEEVVGPEEVVAPERNKTSTTGGKLAVGIIDTLQVPVETPVVLSLPSWPVIGPGNETLNLPPTVAVA